MFLCLLTGFSALIQKIYICFEFLMEEVKVTGMRLLRVSWSNEDVLKVKPVAKLHWFDDVMNIQ